MSTQSTILNTYRRRMPMILDKIEALLQLADDHFGHNPDAIHWATWVGGRVAGQSRYPKRPALVGGADASLLLAATAG